MARLPRLQLHREGSSPCWTPLDQETGSAKRAQYSIGTSAVKRSRLRREYWHLAQDAATFGDVWNTLAGRSKVKGQKVKLFRYQLANLSTLPAGADMRKVEASHLCGNSACFAPGHIAWEAHFANTSRDWCHADGDFACEHVPACFLFQANGVEVDVDEPMRLPSSELSVVPDSEDEDEEAAEPEEELVVGLGKVELERPAKERASSVEVLDLTASDDESIAFGDIEVEVDDDLVFVSFTKVQREQAADARQHRKRLFDLVGTELATLERPQKRQRAAPPIVARFVFSAERIFSKSRIRSRIGRVFRANRPLAAWIQAIRASWKWIE
ncbi:hypothetical protein JCM10296v2_007154 [Rhodotorula toruloides]